jgi:hypothetical protein
MGSFSILHWAIIILIVASPVMGIIRSVKNGAFAHAILSVFLPFYGLIYFFAAKRTPV